MPTVRLPSHEDALAGARAQYALLADAVASLPEEAFATPTRLPGWTVGDLVAHVTAGDEPALPFGDPLVARCVDGVVHGLDLRAATGVPETQDPTALRVTVRALAALLATNAPGRAVEVRVPGHLAVQCVAGPRHTRGTPGSVVEADPVTFVELASGRLPWGPMPGLHASGEHSDLSPYLPVIA